MRKLSGMVAAIVLALVAIGHAQSGGRRLQLQHADKLEVILSKLQDTTFVIGSVIFETEDGQIYCDSAIWLKERRVKLKGRVILDDAEYHLAADSVDYDLVNNRAVAAGDYVELWSHRDSLFAVGKYAFYDRANRVFAMRLRPTIYLKYPDTNRMIKVIADSVHYDGVAHLAMAFGKADIVSKDFSATAGIAQMFTDENRLELENSPVASRGQSRISGRTITVFTSKNVISRLEVHDSARGEFIEPINGDSANVDRSILTGKYIVFDFDSGLLRTVTCAGQAYSWYLPSDRGKDEVNQNTASGDTITFDIEHEKLRTVIVQGGAVGTFLSTRHDRKDTTVVTKNDTIDYKAQMITYSMRDSLITLVKQSEVTSGDMTLDAHRVVFNTRRRVVEAFSAEPPGDTLRKSSTFAARLQPNAIPVVLRDKADVLYGDYLVYAIDTRKGRILKSKSRYETGYFYGNDLYRQQKNVFYLDDGRYTTCDAAEPHFHFYSKHLKLIENDRLIAKPVVLSIGRLPILAIPYYVFPLKKGRHSGILPFTLGNIERGERYIRNVGYYWAASDFWDFQGALDYYERSNTINFYGRTSYARRYVFSGNLSGNYTRVTTPPSLTSGGGEGHTTRWTITGAHHQVFSPSFVLDGSGSYQSDKSFYQDYSTNLNDRLNRVVRSKVEFTKKFGKSYSISGNLSHDEFLDQQKRIDQIPNLTFSSLTIHPFGSGRVSSDGKLRRRFYNDLLVRYSPGLKGYSDRVMSRTVVGPDTLSFPVHKKYLTVSHGISAGMPLTVAKYFILSPSASYGETWYKIFRTELSDSAGIDPTTFYRAYGYSFGASLSTKLFGTVYPRAFGVIGLRQVITPSVSYTYVPVVNKHPEIRTFAGGGPGNATKAQRMSVNLDHLYQAKVHDKKGEERSLQLLSVGHSFSYNFEKKDRKFSDLSTSFSSTLLPRVGFSGGMVHSLYPADTTKRRLTKPILQSFNISLNLSLAGKTFLFDDPDAATIPRGADSANHLSDAGTQSAGGPSGWTLRAYYTYSESGRGAGFSKSSFLRLWLDFNLTPTTRVGYEQSYDIGRGRMVSSSVSFTKQLHCWSGELYWVPTGSTRGYGFRLYVTAIPAIKIDNTQSVISSSYIQRYAR